MLRKTKTMFAPKAVGTDNWNTLQQSTKQRNNQRNKEALMNYYTDLSDNQLFSMLNRNNDQKTKLAIKKELKSRGYLRR